MDPSASRAVRRVRGTAVDVDKYPVDQVLALPPDRLAGPRQLPDLRMTLIDRWAADGVYRQWMSPLYGPLSSEMNFDGLVLPHAALWWVSDEMSRLVEHAASSLPETTITDDLIPDRAGLVYFAHPLAGTDSNIAGQAMSIQAIVWGVTPISDSDVMRLVPAGQANPPGVRVALKMSCYGPSCIIEKATCLLPLGQSDWELGTDSAAPISDDLDELKRASCEEERRWLAALWLLAAQPLTTTSELRDRAAARRSARRNMSASVRLVDVRRAAQRTTSEHGEEGTGRKWGHRTIVGGETGGFWKQQAYGPGWSQRRPIWIAPYIAGPDDKPLIVRDQVKIVRGDR